MVMWMVRAEGGELFDQFLEHGLAALGWGFVPDLRGFAAKPQLLPVLQAHLPGKSAQSLQVQASILWRFSRDLKIADEVLTYDPTRRIYASGTVTAAYFHDVDIGNKLSADDFGYPHLARVDWSPKTVKRDELPEFVKNTLGATLSFFLVPDAAANVVRAVAHGETVKPTIPTLPVGSDIEADPYGFEELASRAAERSKDMLVKLDWREMQALVAGLLRALGYKTRISPDGPDRGKDITASPDGLGLEEPRIVVEVKHRPKEAMGGPEVRSFIGGRKAGEKCLYVSTGGFTKDGRYEAERSNIPMTLMTLEDLVELLTDNFDRLDDATRQLVPMRRLFWPVSES